MTRNEMIYHRKSCRSFIGKPVDGEMIEKIMYEPDGYWAHQESGKDGYAMQEKDAMTALGVWKAKRIKLDMKPFSEYPFK